MPDQLSQNEEFIKKAKKLIEANLDNEQFGVNELSEALGLSRSQLHRKLNKLTDKSTSRFMREFRLEKAMVMLQGDVATASEIAYRVGFSSPTYFNTCFSEYFGYPPGEAKYRNPKTEAGSTLGIGPKWSTSDNITKSKNKKKGTWLNSKHILIIVLAIICVSAFLYINFDAPKIDSQMISEEVETSAKTLAVLPFKNLSDDKDNQYFADGMREDLINHLSKISGILIKSRLTSDGYGSSDLSGFEIGKALGVNYMIDGSVQKYGDRIKIIVHLIDAKNDTHLWSKDFDRKFGDIFNLEKEISTDIAEELDIVLSPAELEQIAKIPTQNLEAYNIYLKGRHFLYKLVKSDFELAEKYFKESILLDPDFALPYSGLAELIMFKYWPRVPKRDYLKAREYALKAIALDNDLAYPHSVLANINTEYEWDWGEAERELKIAMEKEPNKAPVHWLYARSFIYIKGDFEKGLAYANKAIQLDPVFLYSHILKAECYLTMGKYDLALEEGIKAREIDQNELWASWVVFLAYVKQGKDDLAVKELERGWSLFDEIKVNVAPMKEAYEKQGINGVFQWLNDLDINYVGEENVYHSAYWIAQKFAFLGEYDKTIEWLKIAYERRNSGLFQIKYDHFFEDLHDHPEFLAILDKMNLGDYSNDTTFKY